MRPVLISVLAFMLSGSPAFAQSMVLPAQPLRESARVEAAKFAATPAMQGGYRPGGMKPGYFWAAIGLAVAGVGYIASGAIVGTSCGIYSSGNDLDCGGIGVATALVGGGLIAAGGVVWFLGKADASPSIGWTPPAIGVQKTIKF